MSTETMSPAFCHDTFTQSVWAESVDLGHVRAEIYRKSLQFLRGERLMFPYDLEIVRTVLTRRLRTDPVAERDRIVRLLYERNGRRDFYGSHVDPTTIQLAQRSVSKLPPQSARILRAYLDRVWIACVRVSVSLSYNYRYYGVASYRLRTLTNGSVGFICVAAAQNQRRSKAMSEKDARATGLPVITKIGRCTDLEAVGVVAEYLGVSTRSVRAALYAAGAITSDK